MRLKRILLVATLYCIHDCNAMARVARIMLGVPAIGGTVVGATMSGYSQAQKIIQNACEYDDTLGGAALFVIQVPPRIIMGGIYGGLIAGTWPVTMPVAVAKFVEKRRKEKAERSGPRFE